MLLCPDESRTVTNYSKGHSKQQLKPGVHTNDFAPIHGRRARIHRSPAGNYMSTFDSTYNFPPAICEYARGDRESGRNR